MRVSKSGLELIKRWEGCRLEAYQDSVGVWTIGYGITTNAGLGVIKKGMKITQAQADEWLLKALEKYERTVEESIKRSMIQNHFDAMVSLCYNIGQAGFAKSSVVKKYNAGDIQGAADALLLWNKAGGKVLKGLQNRWADERKHFLRAALAAPIPDAPKVEVPQIPAPKKPLSIGTVMAWIIAAIIAAVGAYLGFG